MKVFIIGISGAVGRLLAQRLTMKGTEVSGLVRTEDQRRLLEANGIPTHIGDLAAMNATTLASLCRGFDVVVFTAGSNGGAKEQTNAIDKSAVDNSMAAADLSWFEASSSYPYFPKPGVSAN